MRFRKDRRGILQADISVVPLIDLFMTVLIFFLLSTTFNPNSVFFVDLPEAAPAEGMKEKKMVSISVSATGEIAVDKTVVDFDQLKKNLEEIPKEKRESIPVVIRADRSTPHGKVVSVIDAIRQTGMRNVGIVTKSTSAVSK